MKGSFKSHCLHLDGLHLEKVLDLPPSRALDLELISLTIAVTPVLRGIRGLLARLVLDKANIAGTFLLPDLI